MKPELLNPDNFTPPTRTPWGGRRILQHYKVALDLQAFPLVGESWEVSVEPSFPSLLVESGRLLRDVIAQEPVRWLGEEISARHGGQTPLLVKLLDAADNLSLQVHPEDGDPKLSPGQSGKPESWLIAEAGPGAGLYLGFKQGVTRSLVAECIRDGGELDKLMTFVPVSSGDVFSIPAGTPHAIGAGVTLVEPQFVAPGCRGITYRFWDWNRLYDAQGQRSDAGRARQLHVERCLEVTDWHGPSGNALVEQCRGPRAHWSTGSIGRSILVDWPWFRMEAWSGTGTLSVAAPRTMWALTCLAGKAVVQAGIGELLIERGQSCVVPAAAGDVVLKGTNIQLIATRSQSVSAV
jgi:mannose-6-phosphate isomerase class I